MADEKNFEESAAYFGVSTRTIRRWASDGKLSAPKSGGTMRADFNEELEGDPASGGALRQENGAGGFDEMGVPRRMTRGEAERDMTIRRMGQLEHEAARASWWRRLAACSLLLCLLLALGLAGGATWALQELQIQSASRSALIVAERRMTREARDLDEKAQAEWQQTKAKLTGELAASRVAVETEQRERVRLAEELAAAVTQASAANMLEAEAAAEAQIRMAGLARDLEIAEQRIAKLDQQGQTIDLNELIDFLRQVVEPQAVGDSPAPAEGEATASIEMPQADGVDETEAQPTEEP